MEVETAVTGGCTPSHSTNITTGKSRTKGKYSDTDRQGLLSWIKYYSFLYCFESSKRYFANKSFYWIPDLWKQTQFIWESLNGLSEYFPPLSLPALNKTFTELSNQPSSDFLLKHFSSTSSMLLLIHSWEHLHVIFPRRLLATDQLQQCKFYSGPDGTLSIPLCDTI